MRKSTEGEGKKERKGAAGKKEGQKEQGDRVARQPATNKEQRKHCLVPGVILVPTFLVLPRAPFFAFFVCGVFVACSNAGLAIRSVRSVRKIHDFWLKSAMVKISALLCSSAC